MRLRSLVALIAVAACVSPPGAPVPQQATAVTASFARTWDAVIDQFAAQNIPIHNMERASGFISTDALSVSPSDGLTWADCGKNIYGTIPATHATYNVLVRGDSAKSTVKATVRWTAGAAGALVECSTRGVWEGAIEAKILSRAEEKH